MSLAKNGYAFKKGLTDLGNGTFAYLQPDGSWGWSNAGLITDGDQSLLVDTLFDLKLTGEMLSAMRARRRGLRRRSGRSSIRTTTGTIATATSWSRGRRSSLRRMRRRR